MTYITTMVDESGKVTTFGGVYNGLCVHSEEVTAPTSLSLILFLPQVGQRLTKRFSYILYNHFISGNRLQSKQSPVVNATASKLQLFLSQLQIKPKSRLKYGTYTTVNQVILYHQFKSLRISKKKKGGGSNIKINRDVKKKEREKKLTLQAI